MATIFFCSLNWTNMNDTNRLQMYKVQPKEKNQQQKTLGKYKRSDNTRSLCVQFAHFCWIFNSYLIRTFAQNTSHFFVVSRFAMLDAFGIVLCVYMYVCVNVICICFDSFVFLQIHSLMGTDATFRKRTFERKHCKIKAAEKRARKYTCNCNKMNRKYIHCVCIVVPYTVHSVQWRVEKGRIALKIGHYNSSDCSAVSTKITMHAILNWVCVCVQCAY